MSAEHSSTALGAAAAAGDGITAALLSTGGEVVAKSPSIPPSTSPVLNASDSENSPLGGRDGEDHREEGGGRQDRREEKSPSKA